MLEVDLIALNAIPDKIFTYSPGVTRTYKYDLPTLDDLTVPNDGVPGHETAAGLDVSGRFGGNTAVTRRSCRLTRRCAFLRPACAMRSTSW